MIWVCPSCGDDLEGPKRPAKRHSCRICPGCTLQAAKTVARVPSTGPMRTGSPTRILPPEHSWRGMDLRAEFERLLAFCPEHLRLRPPSLAIRNLEKRRDLLGISDLGRRRITIYTWPKAHLAVVLATLVHELAHFWEEHPTPRTYHGERFRMGAIELLRDGYGVTPNAPASRRIACFDLELENSILFWLELKLRLAHLNTLPDVGLRPTT